MKLNKEGYALLFINGCRWKVGFSDEIDCYGQTNCLYLTIEINKLLIGNNCALRNTIMHELTHAYIASYGMYPNKIGELAITEEQLCCFIASNIDALIKLTSRVYNCLSQYRQ